MIGPPQVGKITLALEIVRPRHALYLDLEDRDDRNRLAEPVLFFDNAEDRLVILDEIHRMPELFQVLRGVIDRGRCKAKGKGRFLILGSASIDLLHQSVETPAGRIACIDVALFSVLEIEDARLSLERLWMRDGFPESDLADRDRDSLTLRKDSIRTCLEHDVALFGSRVPATTLDRRWTMLAHLHGAILTASDLAMALEVSAESLTCYVDLLADLLLVRRLSSFRVNVGRRLVKSPKVDVRDSGPVHAPLGIASLEPLAGHPVVVRSWEGFVIETLLAVLPRSVTPFFYRTTVGARIDLVIEHDDGAPLAVKVKRSLSASVERGFHLACADVEPSRASVVHADDDRYPVSITPEAVGVREFAAELRVRYCASNPSLIRGVLG